MGFGRARAGLAAVAALLGFAGSANASERPLVFHLRFHQVASRVEFLRTGERYALLTRKGNQQVVINDRTGHRVYLRQATGCEVQDIAEPWVLFGTCPKSFVDRHGPYLPLYNLRTGAWVPLRCPYCKAGSWNSSLVLGSHWLWVDAPNNYYYPLCRCFDGPAFFSVPSGAEDNWQPNRDTAGNVDSVRLQQHVCRPDSGIIGPFSSDEAPDLSKLHWSDNLTVNLIGHKKYSYTVALQGCSAHPNIPLFTSTTSGARWVIGANKHLLLWSLSGSRVKGIFIPSLRRFEMRLPVQPDPRLRGTQASPLRLTSTHIYVLDGHGRVWRAPLQSRP